MAEKKNDGAAADALGVRIDALDAALGEFEMHELGSLIALRRQIEFAGQEARRDGMEDVEKAAETAYRSGALDARRTAEALLVAMRKAAASEHRKKMHAPAAPAGARPGVMNREAFAHALRTYSGGKSLDASAVAIIAIANLHELRNRYGAATARELVAHLAGVFEQNVRAGDCLARFDAEEFALFFPGEGSTGFVNALARIQAAAANNPLVLADGSRIPLELKITSQPLDGEQTPANGSDEHAKNRRVGILSRSTATAKVLESRLGRDGFSVIHESLRGHPDFPSFENQNIQAVVVDETENELGAVMTALRKSLSGRRAPMVVLVNSEEEGRHVLELGASEFLLRPVDLDLAIRKIKRLSRRHGAGTGSESRSREPRLLVVSNDLYHLIAIGSALQKQAGCEVYLGRGSSDALAQLERHAPAAVLLDIRLYEHESRELLTRIATIRPAPHIMLIVEEHEANHVPTIQSPKISGVLKKPVQLLTLTEDVRKATGLVYGSAREKAASGLQNEIVRVMQITLGDGI